MAEAYIIFEIDVNDEEAYEEYRVKGGALMNQMGGRTLAGGKRRETVAGDRAPQKLFIIEFESYEAAKAYVDHPEYQALIAVRDASATCNNYILEKG